MFVYDKCVLKIWLLFLLSEYNQGVNNCNPNLDTVAYFKMKAFLQALRLAQKPLFVSTT